MNYQKSGVLLVFGFIVFTFPFRLNAQALHLEAKDKPSRESSLEVWPIQKTNILSLIQDFKLALFRLTGKSHGRLDELKTYDEMISNDDPRKEHLIDFYNHCIYFACMADRLEDFYDRPPSKIGHKVFHDAYSKVEEGMAKFSELFEKVYEAETDQKLEIPEQMLQSYFQALDAFHQISAQIRRMAYAAPALIMKDSRPLNTYNPPLSQRFQLPASITGHREGQFVESSTTYLALEGNERRDIYFNCLTHLEEKKMDKISSYWFESTTYRSPLAHDYTPWFVCALLALATRDTARDENQAFFSAEIAPDGIPFTLQAEDPIALESEFSFYLPRLMRRHPTVHLKHINGTDLEIEGTSELILKWLPKNIVKHLPN
ncbi:MAG: hypothetical protein HY390_03145 [Deltaproteobacteria bacterium]|nr:hypothetical protein [Deltaproteobacteria bacterium]